MHEASLMAGLMKHIQTVAAAEGAARVVGVSVRLGALSHMSADHFAEHFERSAIGTIAEGARLDVTVSVDTEESNALEILLDRIEVET